MINYLIKRLSLSVFVLGVLFSTSMCHVLLEKNETKKQAQIKQNDKIKNNDDSKKEELTRGVRNAPFSLIFTSDIHANSEGTSYKLDQLKQMLSDISMPENNVRGVCIAGDLLDVGSDEQFSTFTNLWISPITSAMPDEPHGGLYLCKGNHDEYSGKKTKLLKFLKNEYGDFRYSFDIEDLHIICCGKYPDLSLFPNINGCCGMSNTIKWLKEDLADVGTVRPVVLFFHFNIMGPFSGWWGISSGSWTIQKAITVKNALYDAVKNYNIKCIFFGHWHASYSARWRSTVAKGKVLKGKVAKNKVANSGVDENGIALDAIPVIDVAEDTLSVAGLNRSGFVEDGISVAGVGGGEYAFCRYDPSTKEFDVSFKNARGQLIPWENKFVTGLEEM